VHKISVLPPGSNTTRFGVELTFKTETIVKRVAAICACLLGIGVANPAAADRHCSYARQSAFYAKELSAEASKLPVAGCAAKMAEALGRLRDARIELGICTCAQAEEPIERWFENHPSNEGVTFGACRKGDDPINAIAKEVLRQVENCF
jgi:hypothetical protein